MDIPKSIELKERQYKASLSSSQNSQAYRLAFMNRLNPLADGHLVDEMLSILSRREKRSLRKAVHGFP